MAAAMLSLGGCCTWGLLSLWHLPLGLLDCISCLPHLSCLPGWLCLRPRLLLLRRRLLLLLLNRPAACCTSQLPRRRHTDLLCTLRSRLPRCLLLLLLGRCRALTVGRCARALHKPEIQH